MSIYLLFDILRGRQSKNFIVQGYMLSVCAYDNKLFELELNLPV